MKIDITSFISAEGGPIWIKFRRLVKNDMSTAVIWSTSKSDVEFQYGGRLGELRGMSSQSHLPPKFYLFIFNAVWALTSGGFRIVSDTLVRYTKILIN